MPDLLAVDHWKFFLEFCTLEKQLKGPDPQLETVYVMSTFDGTDTFETLWRAGLVVGVWNVPTAYILWKEWPYERMARSSSELLSWLTEHWAGIFTRRERRCVRTPVKLAAYMIDFYNWIPKVLDLEPDYEVFWNSVQEVKYMGRYIALKFLEFLNKFCGFPCACPDIRAAGGWSPVKTLSLLFPNLDEELSRMDKNAAKIAAVEQCAAMTLTYLKNFIPEINFFELQVMLCEYRTGYEHRHQYPGRSLDEELEYAAKTFGFWHQWSSADFYEARQETFANEALGELNTWSAIRKELGGCLRDYGYLWTDLRYNYHSTTDLANPRIWRN